VWLAVGRTDMRKGMNGLALQVQQALVRDRHADDLYVFRAARGDLIKIIWHDGIGMSLYASGWSAAGSCGHRRPTARWRSRPHGSPICSTGSTGGTRGIPGGRGRPADLRQVDSAATRGETTRPGFDSIRGMSTSAPLPTDLAEAHALIRRQREELAAAEARASGTAAVIAHLKLVIAKLRRDQYGQSSERSRKVLDQLELQLEELEADAAGSSVMAEPGAADTAVQSFTRRRPVRAPLPGHLPRARCHSSAVRLPRLRRQAGEARRGRDRDAGGGATAVEGDPDCSREVQLP
jgi:transposase